MAEKRYHFKLHKCGKGHNHFHIICGPRIGLISYPFSSQAAAQDLIEEFFTDMIDGDPEVAAFERVEIERIRQELISLTTLPRRDERGRFVGPGLSRQGIERWEAFVRQGWAEFFTGKEKNIGYVQSVFARDVFVPLRCDFVDRPGEESIRSLRDHEKLPARPAKFAKSGVVLERVV